MERILKKGFLKEVEEFTEYKTKETEIKESYRRENFPNLYFSEDDLEAYSVYNNLSKSKARNQLIDNSINTFLLIEKKKDK